MLAIVSGPHQESWVYVCMCVCECVCVGACWECVVKTTSLLCQSESHQTLNLQTSISPLPPLLLLSLSVAEINVGVVQQVSGVSILRCPLWSNLHSLPSPVRQNREIPSAQHVFLGGHCMASIPYRHLAETYSLWSIASKYKMFKKANSTKSELLRKEKQK